MNFFYKKYLWFKFEGQYIPKDIITGISNIIKWLPTIWKDRSYDHSYIFTFLKKKLIFQKEYLEKYSFLENSKRQCELINVCIRLIDKINDDYYHMEYGDYHVVKHDWLDYNEGEYANKGYKEMKTTLISEHFDDYFLKYKLIYKKIFNKYPLESKTSLAMKIAFENQKRCKKLLFSILENNIENWWN